MDFTEESKVTRCQEYMEALEEERRKIQVFQRELPLSLDLINQAIENCKQQLEAAEEEEEETTSNEEEGPVLEEFIPLKRTPSSSDFKHLNSKSSNETKVDWMKSVQLWNQNPDPVLKQELPRKTAVVIESKKKIGGAFHPFHKSTEISSSTTPTAATTTTTTTTITPPSSMATSSTTEKTVDEGDEQNHKSDNNNNNNNRREEKERQSSSSRKTRRCWSPELHRRFLHALQQLGGSHVATPKQIRELMKVDGLTNDEVKSHLQKYRLHTRRPSSAMHNNGNTQAPQFVVVGGIWVPPQEYSTAVTAKAGDSTHGNSSNGIYAPVALQPQAPPPIFPRKQHQQKQQLQQSPTGPLHSSEEGRSSRAEHSIGDNDDDGDNDVVNCRSPSMSSSTHNSTASLTL